MWNQIAIFSSRFLWKAVYLCNIMSCIIIFIFQRCVIYSAEHFDKNGNFTLRYLEENFPEIVQQPELNCYIWTYCNCFYYLTVAHKGFPKAQNVVNAIYEICGPPPREGDELHSQQRDDFARYIRGENYNRYCGFSVFWFTTLTLHEWLMDVSGGNILRKYTFQFIFTFSFLFAEFAKPAPDVWAYRLLPPIIDKTPTHALFNQLY